MLTLKEVDDMKFIIGVLLFVAMMTGIANTQEVTDHTSTDNFEITYIANEGVLIRSHETQILIDGLFRVGGPIYADPPAEELEKLETASPPYDSIDLVLTTHIHGDHFPVESIGQHLLHNENAYYIAPMQAVHSLSSEFSDYSAIENRVEGVTLALFQDTTISRKGVEIGIMRVQHWTPIEPLENVSYLITVDGRKILHLGDAFTQLTDFDEFDLQEKDIDLALIPYWLLIREI